MRQVQTELRELVLRLEPLPDMVSDTMANNPALNEKIRAALNEIDDIRKRVRECIEQRSSF